MGPPGNRGSWGPCVLAQTQKSLLNVMQRRNAKNGLVRKEGKSSGGQILWRASD
ncbi:unnamed protein product [Staurois parvus]|uniref:Uncharacterized protein n=1 Tax=Staurois parvus TaxID=386267 RepID=A0ABN9B7K6_9NEOB|nr:unnamed protein product [Staurois parvus]